MSGGGGKVVATRKVVFVPVTSLKYCNGGRHDRTNTIAKQFLLLFY